jgi:hypothetical protein
LFSENKQRLKSKKDRCRDSTEAVLTNRVDWVGKKNPSIETSEKKGESYKQGYTKIL